MVPFEEVCDVAARDDADRVSLFEGCVDEAGHVPAGMADHLHVDAIGDDELHEGVAEDRSGHGEGHRADAWNLTDLAAFELAPAQGRQVDAQDDRVRRSPAGTTRRWRRPGRSARIRWCTWLARREESRECSGRRCAGGTGSCACARRRAGVLKGGDEVDEGVSHVCRERLVSSLPASLAEPAFRLRLDLRDEARPGIGREPPVKTKRSIGVGPPAKRALGFDRLVALLGVLF
jgi:hypothetical protein